MHLLTSQKYRALLNTTKLEPFYLNNQTNKIPDQSVSHMQ